MNDTARNLCLHYVDPSRTRRLGITPEDLRTLVERELAAGRRPATLDAYRAPGAPSRECFTLSFDDAHRSVLEHGAPLLRALGLTATLFVPTDYVGTTDEFLAWDDLRRLRDAGWTLGAHSATHPRMRWRLYDESPEDHARRLDDECARAREALERELRVEVSLFAYPYGEDPPAAREAVRRAGYRAAFTVRATTEWDGSPLSIPRLDGMEVLGRGAPSSEDPIPFSVVVPACDRRAILAEVLRRLAAQSYPEDRYEVIVVDDGSRESLAPLVEALPSRFRYVPFGRAGRFRAGQARQRGAALARFATLAFLDADVAVGRDFLWHLDWVHRRVPRAVVLGYLSGYNLHDLGHVHAPAALAAVEDLDALPVIPDRSREPTLRACMDNLDWLAAPWTLAYTGNLSLPRALLDAVGGFADAFEGWGLEDVDLGYRLHRAGAAWVFSRFALGHHLVDPAEGASRNPFRDPAPVRERFHTYLANVATLRARHGDDPAVATYCDRALADIDETCRRPTTVGVEFGGQSALQPAFHRVLHRCQAGGCTPHEVLERVAYAAKVGARALYLLGGEPAEHPAFLAVLGAARRAGIARVTVQTGAHPFADPGLARDARREGLAHAVVLVYAFERETYEAVTGVPGSSARFLAGLHNLAAAGIPRSARVVVARATAPVLEATLDRLAREAIPADTLSVIEPADLVAVADRARAWSASRGREAPLVELAAP